MNRDTEDFSDLVTISGFGNKIESHHSLNFAVGPGHLVIIDEADRFIFSEPQKLAKLMKKCLVVCLTATPTSNQQVDIENMIFNSL